VFRAFGASGLTLGAGGRELARRGRCGRGARGARRWGVLGSPDGGRDASVVLLWRFSSTRQEGRAAGRSLATQTDVSLQLYPGGALGGPFGRRGGGLVWVRAWWQETGRP